MVWLVVMRDDDEIATGTDSRPQSKGESTMTSTNDYVLKGVEELPDGVLHA